MTPELRTAARPMPQRTPALNPMVPRRMLLPVIDTNALLADPCHLVQKSHQADRYTALARTGRANP